MSLSNELQIGKAGEHLVCADLILQGYNAFLADQGLPYDVLIDIRGKIKRIAVKSTQKIKSFGINDPKRKGKAVNIYRFGTRRGKLGKVRAREKDVDYFAFVALDIKKIAYVPIKNMIVRTGKIKQTMDFKTKNIKYQGRIYSTGKVRSPEWGKYLEDYGKFPI